MYAYTGMFGYTTYLDTLFEYLNYRIYGKYDEQNKIQNNINKFIDVTLN